MRPSRSIFIFTAAVLFCASRLPAASPIAFQYRDGMIWLKVAVAGHSTPLNFLLDSGAGQTVLDLGAARRLGVALRDPKAVLGVNGRGIGYKVAGFDAKVAGIPISSSPLAIDLTAPSCGCHQHIDGLLGADFLREHIVQIDFGAQVLRLPQRSEIGITGCEVLPLVTRNDALCTRASVNGGALEWMRLDTGCNTALEWAPGRAGGKQQRSNTIGVSVAGLRESTVDVQLGAKHIANVCTGLHAAPLFTGESGLIGNGLLSRFGVTIDAAGRRCLLAER